MNNELIINGIDHSKFNLEWASRGGVLICNEADALFKLITFSCGEGCAHDSCNHWVVVASLTTAYNNKSKYTLYNRRLWGMRMATPAECADAGVEYISPPMMWRDIESAPKDGTEILATVNISQSTICSVFWGEDYNGNPAWIAADFDFVGGEYCDSNYEPTHWMPLPNLPKDNTNVIITERNTNG